MSLLRGIEKFRQRRRASETQHHQARPTQPPPANASEFDTTQTCRGCKHWRPTLGGASGLGICLNLTARQARYQEGTRRGCRGFFSQGGK